MNNREMNNTRGLIIARAIAITVLCICFGILGFFRISGTEIPDWGVRFLGIIGLIALPVAVYASVKIRIMKSRKEMSCR